MTPPVMMLKWCVLACAALRAACTRLVVKTTSFWLHVYFDMFYSRFLTSIKFLGASNSLLFAATIVLEKELVLRTQGGVSG